MGSSSAVVLFLLVSLLHGGPIMADEGENSGEDASGEIDVSSKQKETEETELTVVDAKNAEGDNEEKFAEPLDKNTPLTSGVADQDDLGPCCSYKTFDNSFSCCKCNPLLIDIPKGIPPDAREINFCSNAIEGITETTFERRYQSVTSLILCENQIFTILPGVLARYLPYLQYLDLTDNNFSLFPIGLPATLLSLSIDKNPIAEINRYYLRNLTLLTHLEVSAKMVASDTFSPLRSLTNNEELILHTCHIRRYAFRGSYLEQGDLYLNDTCKDYLDASQRLVMDSYAFAGFPGRSYLYFQNTTIGTLMWRAFTEMKYIQRIYLKQCSLSMVEPGAIRNLPRLVNLQIYNSSEAMALEVREGAFQEVPRLGYVYIYFNGNVSAISPHAFDTLIHKTMYLYLHNNNLQTLSSEAILPVEQTISRLWLYGNPWRCDCDLLWLWKLLRRKPNIIYSRQPQCASPSYLAGRNIRDLNEVDFGMCFPDIVP